MGASKSYTQDYNQLAFAESCGALFHQLRSPSTVAEDVQHAFWLARTRRAPVFFNCPMDIQFTDAPSTFAYVPSTTRIAGRTPRAADPSEIEQAVDLMANARRPVIVAGSGAQQAGARAALLALADRLGAAVATTIRAKGYLDGAWSIGICGSVANVKARRVLANADLVVFVGASVSEHVTEGDSLFPQARTIQIDASADATIAGSPADRLVVGDARASVEAIVEGFDSAGFSSPGFRSGAYDADFALDPVGDEVDSVSGDAPEGTLDPRQLMVELGPLLPVDSAVVIGGGHFWEFAATFLEARPEQRFFYTWDFGTIGQAIPTAFGVAVADPTRPVVVFEGDASALMHIQELDTTARYRPKMLIVVMNDGALASEYHKLRANGFDPAYGAVPTPEFASVAQAFGNHGTTLDGPGQADSVLRAFLAGDGTHVVDVKIPLNVVSASFRRRFFAEA